MSSFLQNGAWPHLFWGQKQRVLEPYSLSLSSMVAAAIFQNLCLEQRNQLSRIREKVPAGN
jgi:hypothetical protein